MHRASREWVDLDHYSCYNDYNEIKGGECLSKMSYLHAPSL